MTFEEAVDQIMAKGFGRAEAEKAAREQMGLSPTFVVPTRDDTVLEKAEQLEIRKIATAFGFNVWVLSQPRASKQTPGLADLWLTHRTAATALWWETKRQIGGALSPAQEDFRDACLRTKTGHGFGDRYAFVERLLQLELAVRGAGQYGIEPVGRP